MEYINNTATEEFKEEAIALECIVKMLESELGFYSYSLSRSKEQLSDFGYVNEYTDISVRQEMLNDIQRIREESNRLYSIKESPYFGRIDFECAGKEDLKFYIGKQGYGHGAVREILDWRSEIASFYYDEQLGGMEFEGEIYELLLKRKILIQKSKLVSVNTVYDAYDTGSEKGIIDPFLIRLLKEKRSQKRISDIIRTIQGNQNQIIREEFRTNLIVQGCAGSGKTMILLHRLSYLLFNNPNWNLNNVLIITPNETFAEHIYDLANDLGIGRIERKSVEQFYCWLMDKICINAGRDYNKNKFLQSENNLSPEVLKRLYAEDVVDEGKSFLDCKVQETEKKLAETGFDLLYGTIVTGEWKKEKQTIQDVCFDIKQAIGDIERESERNEQLQKSKEEELNSILERQRSDSLVKSNILDKLSFQAHRFQTLFIELQNKKNSENSELNDRIMQINREMDSLKQNIGEIEQKKNVLRETISTVTLLNSENIQSVQNENNALVGQIREKVATLLSQYYELECQKKKLAFFQVVTKSNLRKRLKEIGIAINNVISTEKEKALNQLNSLIENLSVRYSRCIEDIARYENELSNLKAKINRNNDNVHRYGQAIVYLKNENWKLVKTLGISEWNNCEELNLLQENLAKTEARIQACVEKGDSLRYEIISLNKKILTQADKEILVQSRDIAENLSFKSIEAGFNSWQRLKYGEYKQIMRGCYRHQYFYRLMLLYFYYGIHLPALFLNVDEAQDISLAEYSLLVKLCGDKTIFNLYGDIKQIINPNKGLNTWEQLTSIQNAKAYRLNENYRNTIQITEDVNRRIGLKMLPIGIEGAEVQAKQEWNDALSMIIRADKGERKAIIYAHKLPEEIRAAAYARQDMVIDKVDEQKISIIGIEMAKGLEFDFVVVLNEGMSKNESYVAYTRALERLVIVS